MMVGKKPKLTRADIETAGRWEIARRELGTIADLAARLGVSKETARKAVRAAITGERMYKRELG